MVSWILIMVTSLEYLMLIGYGALLPWQLPLMVSFMQQVGRKLLSAYQCWVQDQRVRDQDQDQDQDWGQDRDQNLRDQDQICPRSRSKPRDHA